MEKLDINKSDISIHNVIYAITTQQDYEMTRYLFIEPMYKDILYLKTEDKNISYIIAEGYHCSCYDFDDTEFEFIGYTTEELKKLVNERLQKPYYLEEEKKFDEFIKEYLN